MTVEVGIRELRSRLSEYLDRVKAGEEVVVTERGRPIVRMQRAGVPDSYQRLIEAGLVTPAKRPRSGKLPPPIPTKGGVMDLFDELKNSDPY